MLITFTAQQLFEETHVPQESIVAETILIQACQNLDYALLLDLIEIYHIDIEPEILTDIEKEFGARKALNHVLPLRFLTKQIWKNTNLPTVDRFIEVHEKRTEFFDQQGEEVFTITSFYNLDWGLREIHVFYNSKEFRAEFFSDGMPF